ncbi:class I SAM-dependent methyltransferase [Campylobacter sp. MIT 21-1682]|uniref:class I SAM-dependent methyltransferase n=1 Tax=Campylobacter sp. MIT 21-1682 TaxID=2993734 RepID=UPI00224A4CC5|nr:class I SAM-dependent methyltransferase [Campylobacter sp. MIT 21-1682]MCX2752015.1 class I SAM-dependent methyltransferase [Campylobacter sp. MIT 21-1682]
MNESALWEHIFANKEWGKYPSESFIRFIARNFYNSPQRADVHILELGLGTGANLWFCAREGFSVSGIEWSTTGVERFKERMHNENLQNHIKELKIGDYLEKLDEFKDESFDAIVDVCSLACNDLLKTQNIFSKAIKKLKIGGKFYSSTIAAGIYGYDESKGLWQEPKNGIYTNVGFLRFCTEQSLDEVYKDPDFKRTNLSIVSVESEGKILDKLFIVEGIKQEPVKLWGGISRYEAWKMSKISLETFFQTHNKPQMSFENDIYFKPEYAKLYGEVFDFNFQKDDLKLKTIGIKSPIPNSQVYDLQSPYGYSGFFCNTNNQAFLKEALQALKEKALKERIIAFFIRFHPFNECDFSQYLHFYAKERKIVLVPTQDSIEKIREKYSPRIKSYVKKARKELQIEFCKNNEALNFKSLYYATMQRNKADTFYFFDEEYFQKLFKFKESVVLKASLNGETLAFASFFLCKDFSYYHLSGNTLKSNANSALLDFFYEYAHKNGSKFCILGGGLRDNDTLFDFKQKFSVLSTNFSIGGMVYDETEFARLCQNHTNNRFLKYRLTGGGGLVFFILDTNILIIYIKKVPNFHQNILLNRIQQIKIFTKKEKNDLLRLLCYAKYASGNFILKRQEWEKYLSSLCKSQK